MLYLAYTISLAELMLNLKLRDFYSYNFNNPVIDEGASPLSASAC